MVDGLEFGGFEEPGEFGGQAGTVVLQSELRISILLYCFTTLCYMVLLLLLLRVTKLKWGGLG